MQPNRNFRFVPLVRARARATKEERTPKGKGRLRFRAGRVGRRRKARDVTRRLSRPTHWKRWEGVSERCIIRVITLTSLLYRRRGRDRARTAKQREGKGTRGKGGRRHRRRAADVVDALLPANAGLLCIIKAMCRPGLLCRRPCARRYAYNDRLAREFARARARAYGNWCNTDTRDNDDDEENDASKAYACTSLSRYSPSRPAICMLSYRRQLISLSRPAAPPRATFLTLFFGAHRCNACATVTPGVFAKPSRGVKTNYRKGWEIPSGCPLH